jgi:hypothetical protein
MRRLDRRDSIAAGAAALVAFLPFLRGALAGASLYFRDLSLYFFPIRRFALEGLAHGDVRLWNPYVHGGVPLTLPAVGYPVDLVQLLHPTEPFLSLVLALHVPLAAIAFFALVRGLGLDRLAAVGGALVYALGGFLLSCVNLYVYVQAAAWAPLVVLGLDRLLAGSGRRTVAATAATVAVALSTTGAEIVAQAVLVGLVLGLRPRERGALTRAGAAFLSLALGTALAAPVLVLVGAQVEGSARGAGFPAAVVLAHSVHPFTLVQAVVGGLYGNLASLTNEWWGQNFFPRGFPYVLSLYLGAGALAVAGVGALSGRGPARPAALLLGLGLLVALGRWGVLGPIVEAVPAARVFRFPVKAFFTAHLAAALLVSVGLAALVADGRAAWRRLAAIAGGLGALLALLPALPALAPRSAGAFASRFFPPGTSPELGAVLLGRVLGDAATGGLVALGVAAVAVLRSQGRVAALRASWLVVALVGADLMRTGAGLNPMVSAAFYRPSPELQAQLPALREGRVFTCSVESSPAYQAARLARAASHEAWSFALLLETLTPGFNVPLEVPTAMSPDLTMLVPTDRVLSPEEASCRDLDAIVPRLREAGVTTVLSLDSLEHEALAPAGEWHPARVAPLAVRAYRVHGTRPPAADGPGDGRLRPRPPGLAAALAGSVAALAAALLLARRGRAPA